MYTNYLKELIQNLEATRIYKEDGSVCNDYEEAMKNLVDLFFIVKKAEKQVFFIGNGGSAAIAAHMTADFMKNGGMKTYSLYDNSLTTCMGNDYGYEYIFSRPIELLANKEDLLVAISSSGNSQNIINAIKAAKKKDMQIITFSGFNKDNFISKLGTLNVHVPICHYGIVESIHNLILQQIVDVLLNRDEKCL